MFFRDLTSEADYFVTDEHFVTIGYDGTQLTYDVELYSRLIQAMIDGFDTIKLSIVTGGSFRAKYFQGKTKEMIEVSNVDFIQNTKEQLEDFIEEKTMVSTEFAVASLLSDDMVSKIGSGKINEENYTEFLPEVDFSRVRVRSFTPEQEIEPDVPSFQALTTKMFQKHGIFPGEIANISFPLKKDKLGEDGTVYAMSVESKKLLKNSDASDYYEAYLKRNSSRKATIRTFRRKAEFQRFNKRLSIPISSEDSGRLSEFSSIQQLYVRVALLKSGIEVSSKLFPFKNSKIFEEATAGAKNISANLISFDSQYVLPDLVEITNNENFPVEVTVFELSLDDRNGFDKDQIARFELGSKESQTVSARKIFFEKSESRAYAVTANKAIPGIDGVSNVLKILRPPETSSPPKLPGKISLNIRPGSSDSAVLAVVGLKSDEYRAKIFRTTIGTPERIYLGNVTFLNNRLTDSTLSRGEFYMYDAEIEMNGASNFGKISTGHVVLSNGGLTRVSFDIKDPRNRKLGRGGAAHSFKIVENISTTTAKKLLDTVNSSGEAGNFSTELESLKQDTTVITSYCVYRLDMKTGEAEYLGDHEAGKTLRFAIRGSKTRDASFKYYVIPKATESAAVSFKTVVKKNDLLTGKEYAFRYKKWRDKNFNRSEILPGFSEVLKDDVAQALLNIPEGSGQSIDFNQLTNQGRVVSLEATVRKGRDCTFLSWRYSGSLEDVMYFTVFASYNGVKAPVGLAMPDETKDRAPIYSFCDHKLGSAFGNVLYTVQPVLLDGTAGRESAAVKVEFADNYPREALLRNG